LYALIDDVVPLESALAEFQTEYQQQSQSMMASKLGILQFDEADAVLFTELEELLVSVETDMSIFYRLLGESEYPDYQALSAAYYDPSSHDQAYREKIDTWLAKYQNRLSKDKRSFSERKKSMHSVNPKYVFRNYLAQQAIDKAEQGDYSMANELLELFTRPYDEQPEMAQYAAKRPDWARTKVGCSMLSCSS
jgi:uncharacterized protein YdiU (UPF0061 family)